MLPVWRACGTAGTAPSSTSSEPLRRCPECNKKTLRKVMSPVGIVFKGSGFYATDNRSPSGSHSRANAEKNEKTEKSADASTGLSTGGKEAAPAASKSGAGAEPKNSE